MKIDKTKLKKSGSEVPSDCKQLIEHLKSCNEDQLVESLKNIKSWNYGKCELYHWIDVLDYFDSIMERCVHKVKDNQWTLPCDLPENEKDRDLLINIILFTSLLIEHSFSKHVYSSMEHLTTLLASSNMQIVLAVLNLLYVFSKRSNFISRLNPEKKLSLLSRLNHLADSWGGKENGFGLAECCQDLDRSVYPPSATTLHFEFYNDDSASTTARQQQQNKDYSQANLTTSSTGASTTPLQSSTKLNNQNKSSASIQLNTIHIDNLDQIKNQTLAELMEELISTYNVPKDKQMLLFTHLRLAHYFSNYPKRLQCVQARLQALSIIVYSSAMTMQENFNVLYNGFIEELVEVLELKDNKLLEIKAAAIRTLTSVIHLDHTTKLNSIIDITGASSYHGFLPSLVRSCIQALIDNNTQEYTLQFATALFSFLYHLANYESGGEALISCGMVDSLLKVISWKGTDSDHITFVTRAVRVIDLITNLEMAAFHTHADLNVFIDRLEYDVDMCRKDQPFEIEVKSKRRDSQDLESEAIANEQQQTSMEIDNDDEILTMQQPRDTSSTNREEQSLIEQQLQIQKQIKQAQANQNRDLQCYPQRAAVLKSILNFLKKAIQDAAFSDSIRHIMDGSLPKSLKHIISNAEYYGASLFMLATDVVTVYVFQEPSLLSSLQENGLTDVILHALLTKDIPPTKEVLASLPNVFSALCLNRRGLELFKSFKPFDKIFKVLISPEYLPAMRRRRSNDPMNDTSANLGVSMDELMRHLPSLKQSAMSAMINLLKELCKLGSDPDTICSTKLPLKTSTLQAQVDNQQSTARQSNVNVRPTIGQNVTADNGNSSGDDEEEEEDTTPSNNVNVNVVVTSNSDNAIVEATDGSGTANIIVDNLNQNSNSNTNGLNTNGANQSHLASSISNTNLENLNQGSKQHVPLVDYILHVMKFLEQILANNNTEDHCREFVQQKGLEPLLMIHQLPNLPIDFPLSPSCLSLGTVCKSILSLSQEKEVLKQGLISLQTVLDKLKPLHIPLEHPGGSVLLEELVKASELCQSLNNNCDPLQSASLTPLLHNLSAAHAYIAMFIILSRCSHNEIRNICVLHWGSELGQSVLKELGQLYTSLVWESTILLAFCSENNSYSSSHSKFGQTQLERLAALSKDNNQQLAQGSSTQATTTSSTSEDTSGNNDLRRLNVEQAQPTTQQTSGEQQQPSTASNQMDIDESTQFNVEEIEKTKTQVEVAQAILNNYRSKMKSNKLSPETKQIKTLLTSASRLGRALAELFNHLVKLSVNSPSLRQRRNHPVQPIVVNPSLSGVANSLTKLICDALSWVPPISPTPKFRLTFYICCVGFTSPLLFDERKNPYHLMLQSFVQCGGQDAFFETFRWALTQGGKVPIEEGLEHPNLPEGVGEFLDSWLMLLEKMVNPKMVLESPHSITTDPSLSSSSKHPQPQFDKIRYLQQIHKKTFDCIMHLWNRKPLKVYGEHISETILIILCHLLRGETIIKNEIAKNQNDQSKNLDSRNLGLGNLIANPSADSALSRNQQFPAARSSSTGGLVRSGAIRQHQRQRDRESFEENEFSRNQIQQLVDMGFDREQSIDALLLTSTLEQAAEYLIEHASQPSRDFDMSEDDQVLRAIAMSLNDGSAAEGDQAQQQQEASNAEQNPAENQNAQDQSIVIDETVSQEPSDDNNSNNQQQQSDRQAATSGQIVTIGSNMTTESSKSSTKIAEPSTSSTSKDQKTNTLSEDYEPLSKELMDSLTNSLLSGCLKLLDTLPQTVHRVCDILLAVSQRNGEEWTKKMLQQLISEIFSCVNTLIECSKPLTSSDRKSLTEWASQMSQIPEASKAASRIHLFSLLFEEKRNECAQYIEESNLINYLITLLDAAQDILLCLKPKNSNSATNKIITPKWLAPVILLIDLYDKAAVASKRKAPILAIPKRQWKYFDERNGKWCPYAEPNNKLIDDAYCNGESSVRFNLANRRKYCVQFPSMLQVNEETVTYRPVMFVDANEANKSNSNTTTTTTTTTDQDTDTPMDLADDSNNIKATTTASKVNKYKVVKELDSHQNLSLIRACVSFLSIPVDVEALQAVMRLILRITRDYEMAKTFAELGGVKSILKTTQQSEFTEFISLATLIIRHVFEDPATLKQTMEKVLRNLWLPSVGNYREMNYQLRIFGPAACRNSELLSDLAKNLFRIQFNSIVTKKEDEDLRLLQPNAVQILKFIPTKNSSTIFPPTDIVKEMISDLLNALTIKSTVTEDDLLHSIYTINQNLKTKLESMDTNEPLTTATPPSTANTANQETEQMQTEQTGTTAAADKPTTKPALDQPEQSATGSVWRKEDLLLTQSVIMRILAELVKSYNVVAKLITDHQFTAGQSEYVTEDCSALAFILDNLLPNNQFIGDRDSPALARLLIVALASSLHCQDAQVQLISEIKAALLRALNLSESNEKYLRIQALTGIINTMIDTYPNLQNGSSTTQQNLHNLRNLSQTLNSIIFRKGLFIDLARVSHSLDLSSPHMAVTINTVLKPLETLSRAIHPTNQMLLNQKKKPSTNATSNHPHSSFETFAQLAQAARDQQQSSNINQDEESSQLNEEQQQRDQIVDNATLISSNSQQSNSSIVNNQNEVINQQDQASSLPINNSSSNVSDGMNLLNSLLMDVNESFDTHSQQSANNARTQSNLRAVNDSVDENVSISEPMIDDEIVADEYDPSSQHAQQDDVRHVIAIETETEEDNSSEEIDDEDEDDEEDNNEDEDVNDSAAEEDDEDDDEDHGDEDGESDGEEEISFAAQGQDLEDLVLRYAVPDELIWDLEENPSRTIVSTDAPYRYNDIVHLIEGEQHTNGADASQPSVPPAPGTVSAVHPLLSRNGVDNVYSVNSSSQNQFSSSILPRSFRSSRQRTSRFPGNQLPQGQSTISFGNFGAFNLNAAPPSGLNYQQSWPSHIANLNSNNPPFLLQRLLGPNSQNLLQLTRAIQPTRLVFTSNDYQLFTSGNWNDTQIGPESNDSSMINSITSAITRWTEESRVLDSDSSHECIANLRPEIIAVWEKYRDEEINERKEKRKELIEKERKELLEKERKNEQLRAEQNRQNRQLQQRTQSETSQAINASSLLEDSSSPNNDQPSSIPTAANDTNETSTNEQPQSERMEISTQPNVIETEESNIEESSNTQAQNEPEVIEMTCSERISTEHDMEIATSNQQTTNEPTESASINEESSAIQTESTNQPEQQQEIAGAAAATNQPASSSSGNNEEIPEGIDPSFLAALPENIRQEVIAEQLRLQRIQQQRTAAAAAASASNNQQQQSSTASNELNPEFLAALPPVIQEELIAQHNTEQQRSAAMQQQSNPDSPVDPTDFIQTLPLPLRRQVLTDIDDSLLALLPSHLVNEAQMLRDELEARQRHFQERIFTSHATHALSRILRNARNITSSGNHHNTRYAIHTVPQGSFHFPFGSSGRLNNPNSVDSNVYMNISGMSNLRGNNCLLNSKLRCKQLLDNEALSCLLILLFVDEPKLNIGRLHRVLKNLCNHTQTRQWIIKSLLSIMEKAKESKSNQTGISQSSSNAMDSIGQISNISGKSKKNSITSSNNNQTSWLSISMDAALGCRTDVFHIQRNHNSKTVQISINPQAAHVVCRHVLDALISLAKSFPYQFLPDNLTDSLNEMTQAAARSAALSQAGSSGSANSINAQKDESKVLNKDYDFWDVLAKLDSQAAGGRSNNQTPKGKSQFKHTSSSNTSSSLNQSSSSNLLNEGQSNQSSSPTDGHSSTLAQIISLLAHPIIKRSSLLTDKLLRLLSILAKTLPPAPVSDSLMLTAGGFTPASTITANTTGTGNQTGTEQPQKPPPIRLFSKSRPKITDGVGEDQLRLAVEVLTSKSCSEEGLEDVTSFLSKLSENDPAIREIVLKLLLQGAKQLGQIVCQHINNLSNELKKLNLNEDQPSTSGANQDDDKFNKNKRVKGVIQDRFTKNSILISGATNTKHNPSIREVQLPSMTALTCKTSSQSFFLRILKVIISLRDLTSANKNGSNSARSRQPTAASSSNNDQMEIDNKETTAASATTSKPEVVNKEANTLSSQLQLDDLWESLSDCLLELANAPDHHAVLVLQPAVEAFFFVHASEKDQNKRSTDSSNPLLDSRDNLLASTEREPAERSDADVQSQQAAGQSSQPQASSNAAQLSSLNDSIIMGSGSQSQSSTLSKDTQKFLQFADTHKVVLNQILRQSTTPLSEGPFSVLVDHTRVLDFDVKKRYFRTELDLLDESANRREDLAVHVRREHVFEDSFRELYRRANEEWKNRFYIVFENEEGQDAGGLLREWYTIISREIFNPMYALFCTSPGDRVTYMINSSSHCNSNHLQYFKFVGRVIGKSIYDNKLLDCYFTRSFYKHILGKSVKYTDMESEDYTFYQSLVHFLEHDVDELGLDLTFSSEVQEFGVTEIRDLKENGRNIPVTEENKHEYVRLVCQEKMTYSIKKQLSAFLEGFYEIIPKRLISIFNEQELELLISGLPTIDIDDLKANTEYHKYQSNSLQIQWFWRALRSFDQADRAKFLQFVTGTSKVPIMGFSHLEGMNGTQKFQIHKEDRSTDRLPSAHTCFNQLDLPVYETYDKLREMLLKAIRECSEGFGFA